MSQCRRDTPSVPAPIITRQKKYIEKPNRYGCHFASPGRSSRA
jgi:hypothetical protein